MPRHEVARGVLLVTVERHDESGLPVGWEHADLRLVRAFGNAWIRERRTALLVVPAVGAGREGNVLLNPQRPDFKKIVAGSQAAAATSATTGATM